jgi:GNAT superfamily N-acetyltransferase
MDLKVTTVRTAVKEDLDGLRTLMHAYIVDFYEYRPPSDQQITNLIECLLEQQEGIQFVAESDGLLVGFATLYFTFSTLRAKRVVVLNDLFLQETARGTGAAAKLFGACQEYAARNGYASMSWTTAEDNHRAQRFYDKMGGERGKWLTYTLTPNIGVGD